MSHYLTLKEIGRPVAYFPKLANYLDSIEAALFLGQMIYWHEKTDNPLGVYKTSEQIEEETGLSYHKQATARKVLIKLGLLTETHKRLEHRMYFKFNPSVFDAWLDSKISEKESNSPVEDSEIPELENPSSGDEKNKIGELKETESDELKKASSFIHRLPETTSKTTSENLCVKPKKTDNLEKDFETFWIAYPRHVNKKKAFAVFKKIDFKKHPLQTILDSIERWKQSGLWDDPQYIPHPTTWLNGERWTDELPMKSSATQKNGRAGYMQQDYDNVDWYAGVSEDGRF